MASVVVRTTSKWNPKLRLITPNLYGMLARRR